MTTTPPPFPPGDPNCAGEYRVWGNVERNTGRAVRSRSTTLGTIREAAAPGFEFCRDCPLITACWQWAWHEGYDGVAGGWVWRDGEPIVGIIPKPTVETPPQPRPTSSQNRKSLVKFRPMCGTESGYHHHRRQRFEPPCDECRLAHNAAVARRARKQKEAREAS